MLSDKLLGFLKRCRVPRCSSLIIVHGLEYKAVPHKILDLPPLSRIVRGWRPELPPHNNCLATAVWACPLGAFAVIMALETSATSKARVGMQVSRWHVLAIGLTDRASAA